MEQLLNILKQNLDNPKLTVLLVANEMGMSDRHLSRLVKEKYETPVGKFINQFKLEEARKMLESNAYQTVGEVSRAVGFKKQDHFSKIYKELFGTSPSSYFNPTNDP